VFVFSQTNDSYSFDSYFIKSKDLTADRIVKFYQTLEITNLGNKHFLIKADIGSKDRITAAVTFTEKSFFAGVTYFEYEGQGLLSGEQVRFIVESGRDLEDFSTGVGYKEYTDDDLSLFEIKLYYWPNSQKEPLLKNNIAIYPIMSIQQKPEEQDSKPVSQVISEFIADVAENDPGLLAKRIKYPLLGFDNWPNIESSEEFVKSYGDIFDVKFIEAIKDSNIDIDWGGRVWEGIMFRNGDLWLDFDGNIIAINYRPRKD
tara:strand:+ start:389 stop:1165 length:777 start_codon:yes stop_codon:yes gene_type:complete